MLTILVFLWLVIYLIPSFFVSLFDTFLGRIILGVIVILIGLNNYKYGIVLIIIVISMYYVTSYKEGFDWSQDSIDEFILLQKTINPHVVFDITQIKQQATQEELNYFLKNSKQSAR